MKLFVRIQLLDRNRLKAVSLTQDRGNRRERGAFKVEDMLSKRLLHLERRAGSHPFGQGSSGGFFDFGPKLADSKDSFDGIVGRILGCNGVVVVAGRGGGHEIFVCG